MSETPADIRRWDDYYRDHHFGAESSFAQFVRRYFSGPLTVVELGCGDGRDAAYFHRQGCSVVAVDRAASGIASARRKLGEDGTALHFHVGDVADRPCLAEILRDPLLRQSSLGAPGALVLYLRFFLHAIPEETEAAVLDAASVHLPAGFFLAAEFRTDADAHLPKAEGVHYRRFIAPADMHGRLGARGFEILHREARFGLSVYRGEDPHLCRIVARKDGASPR